MGLWKISFFFSIHFSVSQTTHNELELIFQEINLYQYIQGYLYIIKLWGTWVAGSVKRLTLDLGSGHDLSVRGFKPRVWLCAEGAEPAWNSLSRPLSLPLPCSLSFKNKYTKIIYIL